MYSLCRLVLALAMVFLAGRGLNAQQVLPKSWGEDATLRAVHFVDHDYGWAVGNRGTILRTEDGGRNWVPVSSPRDAIWSDVFFINEKVGWICGGYYRGYLDRSVGVLIRTIDGGKSWQNLATNGMPFFRQIRFLDEQQGYVVCDPNSLYPSGGLVTTDGGNHWRKIPGLGENRVSTMLTLSSGNGAGMLGVTRSGQVFELRGSSRARMDPAVRHPVEIGLADQILDCGGVRFCLVDGKIWRQDGLRNWIGVSPSSLASGCRIKSICNVGKKIWAVGAPGNVVHFSPDGGKQWSRFRTGFRTPLASVFFLNGERGWAVGSLGRILSTKDGGKTWTCQRNPQQELGVLALSSGASDLPVSCLTLLAGSFNHLCGTEVLSQLSWTLRKQNEVCQALNRCGNSAFCVTPIPDGALSDTLVMRIRMWRPAVLVVNSDDFRLRQVLESAIRKAADPAHASDMIEQGLEPWQVQKTVSVSENHQGKNSVAINRFSAQLGRSVELQARFAARLLGEDHRHARKPNISWNLVSSIRKSSGLSDGITTGTMAYDHPARNRKSRKTEVRNMQQFRAISNWSQNLDRLGQYLILSELDQKAWVEALIGATSGLDPLSYEFFLQDLERRYCSRGKPVMADHTLRLILQNIPDSEAAERAMVQLMQRYASDETNQQLNRLVNRRITGVNRGLASGRKLSGGVVPEFDPLHPEVRPASHEVETVDVVPASMKSASQLVEIFQSRFPDVADRPDYALLLARIKALNGNLAPIQRLFDQVATRAMSAGVRSRINREKELMGDRSQLGEVIWMPAWNDAGVMLDATLEEPIWSNAGADGLRVAKDQRYLYLGGQKVLSDKPDVPGEHVRRRDEDLSGHPRARIFLDFDRDDCTGVELTIDVRGACNDRLWRDQWTVDRSYDPVWYVAAKVSGQTWTFEAAIPLDQLPLSPNRLLDAWVIQSEFLAGDKELGDALEPRLGRGRLVVLQRKPTSHSATVPPDQSSKQRAP